MKNRFFTIMIVPEASPEVKKWVIPSWVVRISLLGLVFGGVLSTIMIYDYWYVMSQIGENKQLKLDNRRLRQQVQIFRNKMTTVESTMERVKTFATRLKVITNVEDRGNLIEQLNQKLPDASGNIPGAHSSPGAQILPESIDSESLFTYSVKQGETPLSLEEIELRQDISELDEKFAGINEEALLVEQILQDQYELLADKQAFLSALPTRKPATGYFTSGFGVRKAPLGDRIKMHEGLDIANLPGTLISSPADGTVVFSETKPGYGQTVIIDHGYGLETWYAHTRKMLVSKGQKVRRGDPIAQLGNSGRSTGPHLHYEVRVNGTPVDPMSYILEN
jgi:murein DD-endopeptidase MepM/ murein hydrolase activator NlpD